MNLTGSTRISISLTGTKVLDLSTPQDLINVNDLTSFEDGDGDDQASQHWSDQRTLTTGDSEDIDLAGVLVDAFGDTITFVTIKGIYIKNSSLLDDLILKEATDGLITLLSASAEVTIKRGGRIFIEAPKDGYAVSGSADRLTLTHAADTSNDLIYDIVLLGTV